MIYPVYSIKDVKGDFWSPRVSQNDASMKREFGMMVNTGETLIHQYPGDFELYKLGEFDSKIGIFKARKIPEFMCRGDELVGV